MVTRYAFITYQIQHSVGSKFVTKSVFVDFGQTEPTFVNMHTVIGDHLECYHIKVLDFKFLTHEEFVFLTKNVEDNGPFKIVCKE